MLRSKFIRVCLQFVVLQLGFLAVAWATFSLPQAWSAVFARDFSSRLISQERFRADGLDNLLRSMAAFPSSSIKHVEIARSNALLSLRRWEQLSLPSASEHPVGELGSLGLVVKQYLAVNPTDSFVWVSLYSSQLVDTGFDASLVGLLGQSYATGPLEGWIAVRRNQLALACFSNLDDKMQFKVLAEFAGLVDSDFVQDAAANLMRNGWEYRDRLLASLTNTHLGSREIFAKKLLQDGVDIIVPGVQLDGRVWR